MTDLECGKDRYGPYIIIDGFRSAMPSIDVAEQIAWSCNLFDEAIAALRLIEASGICRYDPDLWQPMSAVLRKVDHPNPNEKEI